MTKLRWVIAGVGLAIVVVIPLIALWFSFWKMD